MRAQAITTALLLSLSGLTLGQGASIEQLVQQAQSGGSAALAAVSELERRAATDPNAANSAGALFYYGIGVEADQAKGQRLWRASAADGNASAKLNLAETLRGEGKSKEACQHYVELAPIVWQLRVTHAPNDEASRSLYFAAKCYDDDVVAAPASDSSLKLRERAAIHGDAMALAQVVRELSPPGDDQRFRRREVLLERLLTLKEPLYQALVAYDLFNAGAVDLPQIRLLAEASASAQDYGGCYLAGIFALFGFQQQGNSHRAKEWLTCAALEPQIRRPSSYFLVLAELDLSELQPSPAVSRALNAAWEAGAVEVWDLAYEINDVDFLARHPAAVDCDNLCPLAEPATAAIRAMRLELERLAQVEQQAATLRQQEFESQAAQTQLRAQVNAARRERRRAFWNGFLSVLAAGATAYGNQAMSEGVVPYQHRFPTPPAPEFGSRIRFKASEYSAPASHVAAYSSPPASRPMAVRYSFSSESGAPTTIHRQYPQTYATNEGRPNVPGCMFDSQCGFGLICVVTSTATQRGMCIAPVDEFGMQSSSPALAGCYFDVDCPTSFACQRDPSEKNGVCLRN